LIVVVPTKMLDSQAVSRHIPPTRQNHLSSSNRPVPPYGASGGQHPPAIFARGCLFRLFIGLWCCYPINPTFLVIIDDHGEQ